MIQAIVFDFDGVIADTEPLHHRAFLRVLRPVGFDFDYPTYLQKYVGFDDRDMFRTIYEEHGETLEEDHVKRLVAAKAKAFAEVVAQGVEACAGAVDLIVAASDQWRLAVASGALRSDIELILPAIGDGHLAKRFSAMVTAEDVARSKPDPATYIQAARRLEIDPSRCLAIEDTTAGIASAQGAGMRVLAVATTHPESMLADADRVVDSLERVDPERLIHWFG
jgi:beta-phosphoglucomutase